jgi:hypothetical protein
MREGKIKNKTLSRRGVYIMFQKLSVIEMKGKLFIKKILKGRY